MSAQVLTYLPTFKEAAMFRLEVLHRDAERIEHQLKKLGKTFNVQNEVYTTVFFNSQSGDYLTNAANEYLGTGFVRGHDLKVAYLTNNLATQILLIERDGSSYSTRQIAFINWQQQSERAAKIELYALTGIDKEHWVL